MRLQNCETSKKSRMLVRSLRVSSWACPLCNTEGPTAAAAVVQISFPCSTVMVSRAPLEAVVKVQE